MQDNKQDVEVLKIRSLNKIAYLRARGITQNNMYVENDNEGKPRVTFVFEMTQEVKDLLDKYYLDTKLKETLRQFSLIRNEIYQLLKGLE